MVWQKRTSPDARRKISTGHEYILVYVKSASKSLDEFRKLAWDEESAKNYKNPDNDPRGPWISTDCTAQAGHGTKDQFYTMITPAGRKIELPNNLCWRFTKDRMDEEIEAGRIWFGADGKGVPRKKTYLSESDGRNLWTWWSNNEVGHTQEATKELTRIFGNTAIFDYPKPVRLISRMIQIATDKDSIILDSFAGSGTTAHAVLNMNKADGGHRKFILIEMMEYAETITAERVRRVIDGYGTGKNAVDGTGGDFAFYDLGEVLLLPDGNLNESVGADRIREYVWYMETKTPLRAVDSDNPYYLGESRGTGYYFFYEKEALTTLNFDFLSTITEQAEGYLIYADLCTIPDEELKKYNITFKKIPRDIARL